MTEARAEVDILGQRLLVRGQGTPEYIRELAAYLDARAQLVRDQARVFDPLRLSLLTGLHVADELHRCRAADREMAERLGHLADRLRDALEGGPGLDAGG
jgi:cell division protein ZapA (FtsZ GTPase activity inhibitor)